MPSRRYEVEDPFQPGRTFAFDWDGPMEPTKWDIQRAALKNKQVSPLDKFLSNVPEQAIGAVKGIGDVAGGVLNMFNPVDFNVEAPNTTGLEKSLGFRFMTPSRHMAEGMANLAIGAKNDVQQGNYTRAALAVPEVVGLPTTSAYDSVQRGEYGRAAGQLATGAALLYAGAKAHANSRIPPVEKPVIRGLLEPPRPNFESTVDPGVPPTTYPERGPTSSVATITRPPKEPAIPAQFGDKFLDWDGARNAAEYEAKITATPFENLRQLGLEGIKMIQAGINTPEFKAVRSYFNEKFAQLRSAGLKINYREHYLPQLWENTQQEIAAAFGDRLNTKPGFSLERVIEDYQTGIEKGLKPRFDSVPDLIGWYENRANRAIADLNFFHYLRQAKLLMPKSKAPHDWAALNPDTFPIIAGQKVQAWAAPTRLLLEDGSIVNVAEAINNHLGGGSVLLDKISRPSVFMKNLALTGGLPWSGINWHGMVNIWGRALASGPLRGPVAAARVWAKNLDPREIINQTMGTHLETYAAADLKRLYKEIPDAVRHNLEVGAEGFKARGAGSGKPKGFIEKFESAFGDVLFGQIIPTEKLRLYLTHRDRYIKAGIPEKQAKRAAAKFANDMFGGIANGIGDKWYSLSNKQMQQALRATALAPDWLMTKFRIGKEAAMALTNPKDPRGRAYLGVVAQMAVLKFANDYMFRGRFPSEQASRSGNIPAGKDSRGREREIDPYGAAFETVDLPTRIVAGATAKKTDKENPLETIARFGYLNSSIPAQKLINFSRNEDWRGRAIYGTDKYGRPVENQYANIAGEIADMITPQMIQGIIDYNTGRNTAEESLFTALELPVRFYTPSKPKGWLRNQKFGKMEFEKF